MKMTRPQNPGDRGGPQQLVAEVGLDRTLGFGQITASGVGIIIGAGIYVLLGSSTAEAGSAVWLSFLLAGGLSALTALSYAELASMFPSAGAEYEYTRQVAPPWMAFVVGWVMILGLVIASAAVALGFASYLRYFVAVPLRLGAWALLGLVTLVALGGIKQSARLTVTLSAFQVGGLLVIIAIGIPHLGEHSLVAGSTTTGVVSAAALVFFAFIGFDEVITLAEETKNPGRTVPRALLLALAVSTLLYVAVAVAAISVLGPAALGASEQPLADVMAVAVGSRSATMVAVIAMIATTNTSLLAITAASRLQYGMAHAGVLPEQFRRLNSRRAPWIALIGAATVAAGFVGMGDLELVAGITDFSVYLVFVAVNAAVILLRFRQPNRPRPFAVRGRIGALPLIPVGALCAVGLLLPSLEVGALLIGAMVALVGVGVYLPLSRLAVADELER